MKIRTLKNLESACLCAVATGLLISSTATNMLLLQEEGLQNVLNYIGLALMSAPGLAYTFVLDKRTRQQSPVKINYRKSN